MEQIFAIRGSIRSVREKLKHIWFCRQKSRILKFTSGKIPCRENSSAVQQKNKTSLCPTYIIYLQQNYTCKRSSIAVMAAKSVFEKKTIPSQGYTFTNSCKGKTIEEGANRVINVIEHSKHDMLQQIVPGLLCLISLKINLENKKHQCETCDTHNSKRFFSLKHTFHILQQALSDDIGLADDRHVNSKVYRTK